MDTRRGDAVRGPEAATEELRPDEAIFTVEALGRQERSLPIVAAATLVLGIVGVAIAGTIGRSAPTAVTAERPRATADAEAPAASTTSLRFAEGPFGSLDGRTGVTPGRVGRPLLTVDADRSDGMVFVHGDVFTRRAVSVVVVVTVVDARNRTLIVQSVDIPGGSTAFRLGSNDRFNVAFDLPDSPTVQATTVTADAYDDAGAIVASARTQLGQFVIEAPVAYR